MIDYLNELNEAQFNVVRELEGTCLVIAGAGVGKTHLLTMRVARMLDSEVKPENILLLTFTNKAAKEMKQRVFKLVGDKALNITACTYHSFCAMILRDYASLVGLKNNYNIIDNPETAITKILRQNGYKGKTSKEMPKSSEIYSLITNEIVKGISINYAIQKEYSQFTNKMIEIREVIDEFIQYKLDHNVVDYTDLLVLCNDLLKNNIDIARKLAKKYEYIMVDEFQDSNNLQCQILKNLICDVHRNLMVVGDDMQSIYAFNGANYKNILNFPKEFSYQGMNNVRINVLEQNYRSSQGILNLANSVIREAPYKFEKNLWTEDTNTLSPRLVWTDNSDSMVRDIYKKIVSWQNLGYDLEDIAVLARTSNELNLLESCFVRDKIPYQKYGGIKFFEKAHIKDVMAFLKVLSNYQDELAWLRILPLLPGLGDATAEKISKEIVQKGYDALINKKFQGKKYSDWLMTYHNYFLQATKDISTHQFDTFGNKGKPHMSLDDQMELLKNSVLDSLFEVVYPEDYDYKLKEYDMFFHLIEDYETATEFLEDVLLNGTPAQVEEKEHSITLSTVHSAKGLEWENVIIMNCIEGGFPSMKTLKTEDRESIEEERRLLYVAITRAKRNLILMCPHNYGIYGQIYKGKLSRYLTSQDVQNNLI